MKKLGFTLLYTAALALANPVSADVSAAKVLSTGSMKKLVWHDTPRDPMDGGFVSFEGDPLTLENWQGKWVVLNFWATWCAPCRKEMPALSALQAEMGGDQFEVVTVAAARKPSPKISMFLNSIGVDNLPKHLDTKGALGAQAGAVALPLTLILDPKGHEVARMFGEADWASDEAKAMIKALTAAAP